MATRASKKKVVAAVEENAEVKEVKKKTVVKKTSARKKAAAPASKAAAVKKVKTASKKAVNNYPNAYLMIDHPVEKETICGSHYAVRIGASNDGYVEISFDGGEWQPCRFGGGYWWFDWTYFNIGDHTIAVRLMDPNGSSIIETTPRKCAIC
ncbi:MAG: hypothetical protein FWH43_08470 [Endomicrobia bacterium]|nr:hypothetical protein [Endomicrobiia bacterium]